MIGIARWKVARVLMTTLIVGLSACAAASGNPGSVNPGVAGENSVGAGDYTSLAERGDSIAIARAISRLCRAQASRAACYEAQFVPLATAGHVKIAMGALDQLGALDEDVRRTGHVYAHAIGIAAGKTRGDVARTFSQCSESFQSGCYHGVIQAWFAGLDSIGAKEANSLCEPFRSSESTRWLRFQCVHGMGHGLTMLHDHNLPMGLTGCDLLTDWWDRHSCYSGAFMENIVNVTNPHHPASALAHHTSGGSDHTKATEADSAHSSESHDMHDMHDMHDVHDMAGMDHGDAPKYKPVDPADQHYPCSALPDRYQSACYEMQTSVMLYNNKGDIAGAARACDTAPKQMRVICYVSLGRDVSSYSAQNHAAAVRMCSMGTVQYQPWCYFGLVKNIIDLNARPEEGIAMCRDVPSSAGKVVCYSAVGQQISVLVTDIESRRKACSTAESDYANACLYGARVRQDPPAELTQVWQSVRN
jgi:hypothetical protein